MNSTKSFMCLTLIAVCLGLGFVSVSLAQENATKAVNLDENIQAEDLDIEEPNLLPDSPFYFLKNWGRGIQSFFTFNPIKKAELKSKFANEKLIELKRLVELKKSSKIINKAADNYQDEIDKIKEASEKIKEKAEENTEVEKFLDKFIKHEFLHQNLLTKLETQVPDEAFEKIKQAREKHLERFAEVMAKLQDKANISERLEKNLKEIEGSKYKNFKNLEVLLELEEKVPEQAREAIKKAQGNALKRLQGDLGKMSPDDQERFADYIDKISGDKEKHLEILDNLKSELQERPILKQRLIEMRESVLEKVEETDRNCPEIDIEKPSLGFCDNGRIVLKRDENGCIIGLGCIIPGEVEIPKIRVSKEPHCDWCGDACVKIDPREPGQCPAVEPPQGLICVKENEKCVKKAKPEACIMLWDPVCGKNSKTYSNECFAELAEIEIDYKGVCK